MREVKKEVKGRLGKQKEGLRGGCVRSNRA